MLAAIPYSTVARMTRAAPRAVTDAPRTAGETMAATPVNPSTNPTICTARGARRRRNAAVSAAKSGIAPLSMPASEESIHCWAIGNSRSGAAIHTRAIRRKATSPGSNASRPSAMNTKEDPHISPIEARRPHSTGPNASARVPGAVVITRAVRIASSVQPRYASTVRRVDYVIRFVHDLDASVAFYRDLLGVPLKVLGDGYVEFDTENVKFS